MKKIGQENHAAGSEAVEQTAEALDSQQDIGLDLESLRLTQDFGDLVGVKKKLVTVRVDKPDRRWFVRVPAGGSTCVYSGRL